MSNLPRRGRVPPLGPGAVRVRLRLDPTQYVAAPPNIVNHGLPAGWYTGLQPRQPGTFLQPRGLPRPKPNALHLHRPVGVRWPWRHPGSFPCGDGMPGSPFGTTTRPERSGPWRVLSPRRPAEWRESFDGGMAQDVFEFVCQFALLGPFLAPRPSRTGISRFLLRFSPAPMPAPAGFFRSRMKSRIEQLRP